MKRLVGFFVDIIEFLSIAGSVAFISFCSDPVKACNVYMSAPEAARNAFPCLYVVCIVVFYLLFLAACIVERRKFVKDPFLELECIACNQSLDVAYKKAKDAFRFELHFPVYVFLRWLSRKTDNKFIQALFNKHFTRIMVLDHYIDYCECMFRGISDDEDGGDVVE